MSSSLRRGALAASAIVFSIASLAACGAGNNSQTLEIKPDNAATTVGDIKVQNALVITEPATQSTGPAVVAATLFNTGTTDQTLQSIALSDGPTAKLSPAKGKDLTVPAGGSLVLGGDGNASAVFTDSTEAIQDGNAQKVTFTFSKTGDVSLSAFVVPAESYFSSWGPSTVPSAPAGATEPSGSVSPSAGETAGAGDSVSSDGSGATPSDSASESATISGG